jgi:hypothetical protein
MNSFLSLFSACFLWPSIKESQPHFSEFLKKVGLLAPLWDRWNLITTETITVKLLWKLFIRLKKIVEDLCPEVKWSIIWIRTFQSGNRASRTNHRMNLHNQVPVRKLLELSKQAQEILKKVTNSFWYLGHFLFIWSYNQRMSFVRGLIQKSFYPEPFRAFFFSFVEA